jgi:nucleotide-binding universal stress UspA family protein
LTLRQVTKATARRRPKPSLLRQAIVEQLSEAAMARRRVLLATAGSATNAPAALEVAKAEEAALVVCFIRDVALSYKVKAEESFTLDTDPAAQLLFREFLARGHQMGVPIIPAYDTGSDAAESIAELAAMNAVEKVLIGTSRRGTLYHLIKGSFQRKLEDILPPEIPVEVLPPVEPQEALLHPA